VRPLYACTGLPIVRLDAGHASAVLKMTPTKTATTRGAWRSSCVPAGSRRCGSSATEPKSTRALLAARDALVSIRARIENEAQGLPRTFGILFGTRVGGFLPRFDHSNIFLIIARPYTPLTVMLLEGRTRTFVLLLVWIGAFAGLLFRVLFLHAPRWLYVPLYVALGWVAVGYIKQFYEGGGAAVVWLVAAGGLCYTVGAVFYGFKWPGRSARWISR